MAGRGNGAPVLDDEALEAARAFGYKGDAKPQKNDLEIWPENWEAVTLAVNLGTQWRVGPAGNRSGYDYSALPIVENQLGFEPDRERFERLRIIENEIIKAGRK